jgi:hypothetical protein
MLQYTTYTTQHHIYYATLHILHYTYITLYYMYYTTYISLHYTIHTTLHAICYTTLHVQHFTVSHYVTLPHSYLLSLWYVRISQCIEITCSRTSGRVVWLTDNQGFVEYSALIFRLEGFFDADGTVLIHEKFLNYQMVKNSIIGSFIICTIQ